ncbi:MAG: hypothetical protein HY216_13460 [Candidatus Rokubacteria bacterium]|nr:hypothetical protein [Candidatus Rokubacteria bacterium]
MIAIAVLVPLALLAYAAYALLVAHWWVSGLAASIVAALLWTRHPRARFSAYVLLSVIVLRGLIRGEWGAAAFGAVAIAVLQLPASRRAWPRIPLGRSPRARGDIHGRLLSTGDCSRMARP